MRAKINKIVDEIRKYYKDNNLGGAVIGISGGKDSAVVLGIMVEAIGRENIKGLYLPCNSDPQDFIDAKKISDFFETELIEFDLNGIYNYFNNQLSEIGNFKETDLIDSDINFRPRLRMMTLYYFAALFTNLYKKKYLVIGTSNKCELYVGYFTKGGDSVNDLSVIANLTVSEVIEIGKYIKIPSEILFKTPHDGLSKFTDEEKLGVSYKQIEDYLKNPKLVDKETKEQIEKLHKVNSHKFFTEKIEVDD